jgi:hypothetical protein
VRQRADAEQQQIDDEVRIGFYSVVHGASRCFCMHACMHACMGNSIRVLICRSELWAAHAFVWMCGGSLRRRCGNELMQSSSKVMARYVWVGGLLCMVPHVVSACMHGRWHPCLDLTKRMVAAHVSLCMCLPCQSLAAFCCHRYHT